MSRSPMHVAILWMVAAAVPLQADAQQSPYAGLEDRPIKALSDEERNAYLNGAGMSLALAAELNGLPGPKHVLELAEELSLTTAEL